MNENIGRRLTRRIRQASVNTVDTIADYSERMGDRLGQISDHLDRIEQTNKSASEKIIEAIHITTQEATTRNELISRLLSELHGIISQSGEELSQVSLNLSIAKTEIETGEKLAADSSHDIANVEMLARTGKLFAQSDIDTVTIAMDEVQLPILQEALERLTLKRWLELEGTFEAARQTRKGK